MGGSSMAGIADARRYPVGRCGGARPLGKVCSSTAGDYGAAPPAVNPLAGVGRRAPLTAWARGANWQVGRWGGGVRDLGGPQSLSGKLDSGVWAASFHARRVQGDAGSPEKGNASPCEGGCMGDAASHGARSGGGDGDRLTRLFAALRVRNFRLYFTGQAISLVGTWMQSVGLIWLVLELSGSGTLLGVVVAVQFLPVLLLGAYAGLVVDRLGKRRLLLGTQLALRLLALALGGADRHRRDATVDGLRLCRAVRLRQLTRQSCPPGLRDGDGRRQPPAERVSLNSAMVNASRALGPAIAGGLIATVGVGICFLINSASFIAVLVALALMRVGELRPSEPVPRRRGQLRAGFRYVRRTAGLLVPLLMMALIGTSPTSSRSCCRSSPASPSMAAPRPSAS